MHAITFVGRVALTLILLVVGAATAHANKKPNILVIVADDMRPDVIGKIGPLATPTLDRLMLDGTTFRKAYIMGGLQGAVCVPSRAMLLSGRSLFKLDTALKNTPTWATVLRALGYRLGFTGKWHNGQDALNANFPGARTAFLGGMLPSQMQVPLHSFDTAGKLLEKRTEKRHSSMVFTDEALRFLKQKHETPWALYVAFTAPHDPRDAPLAWRKLFNPAEIALPPNFLPEHPFDNGELKIRDELLEKWPRTKEAIQKHLADYYAMIAHMDAQLRRIIDVLVQSGQIDNTIILFVGDNGLAIGSHGLMGKQNLYEHSVRVPLIVRGPGIKAGVQLDALCYLNDLCPTICELAGGKAPDESIGRSLLPLLKGEQKQHREALLFAYRDVQRGCTDGRWKTIWYPNIARWQLFDLAADPHEIRDLATSAEHRPTLERMQLRLAELRRQFGDTQTLPRKDKQPRQGGTNHDRP